MAYGRRELDRVRELAREVVAIAREPRMSAIKKRWADVNALRKPDRAPVWCRPVGCWAEILTEEMLVCQDPLLRQLEHGFLQIMHKRSVGDDEPVEECLEMGAVLKVDPPDVWGVPVGRHNPGTQGGAWAYDPPLKDMGDIKKLRTPAITYCEEETAARKCQLEDILDGILPVRVRAEPPLGATLGTTAADLRGLEQMMLDMAVEPVFLHRLMAHLRDATLAAMDVVESAGILTPNNTGPMTCSDPVGSPPSDGKPTCANLWCMANSQEFDQVSPAMWEEFCLAYQMPILERFGLVGYGCCENLTQKLDGVLSIPNLRILTCSAWTDLDTVIGRAGNSYCIMWRQKASDVVFPDDPGKIREDLMDGARRLQSCHYQIVLRELQTLAGHPERLHEWTRFAIEAAETHA